MVKMTCSNLCDEWTANELNNAMGDVPSFHPPSPEAPPLGGEEGEARVASERFRPTGVQEGATGLPVGLHIKPGTRVHFEAKGGEIMLTLRLWFDSAFRPRSPSLRIPPLTPQYFERMAGFLGTGGKATKSLLEERKKEREL